MSKRRVEGWMVHGAFFKAAPPIEPKRTWRIWKVQRPWGPEYWRGDGEKPDDQTVLTVERAQRWTSRWRAKSVEINTQMTESTEPAKPIDWVGLVIGALDLMGRVDETFRREQELREAWQEWSGLTSQADRDGFWIRRLGGLHPILRMSREYELRQYFANRERSGR